LGNHFFFNNSKASLVLIRQRINLQVEFGDSPRHLLLHASDFNVDVSDFMLAVLGLPHDFIEEVLVLPTSLFNSSLYIADLALTPDLYAPESVLHLTHQGEERSAAVFVALG
jgi:hypothetical protein